MTEIKPPSAKTFQDYGIRLSAVRRRFCVYIVLRNRFLGLVSRRHDDENSVYLFRKKNCSSSGAR